MKHRHPPLPHWKSPKGSCRWCGEAVLKPNGESSTGRWHPKCVTAYKIAAWPAEARKAVYVRDRGRCRGCRLRVGDFGQILNAWHWSVRHGVGATVEQSTAACARRDRYWTRLRAAWEQRDRTWQADHIVELVDSDRDLRHWSVENLQILCTRCHSKKTTESRRARKAAPQPELFRCSGT